MKTKSLAILTMLILQAGITFSQTWDEVTTTGTTFILYGMSFPPAQSTIGFACGMQYTYDAPGVIVKTVDGGDNWTQIWPASGEIDGLQGIWFISDLVGFACGWNGYFIKTIDGGTTWTPVTVGSGVWYYRDVEFWDANNGVAVAAMNSPTDQAAFITSDGGNTWVPSTSGLATGDVYGISYASSSTVYAVGTSGSVYKSTDGGHNWTVSSTLSAMLFGVDFANTTFGVIGGEETMFATNDGGSSYTSYVTGYENFYATHANPDGSAYIGGTDNRIWKTTDYGANWVIDNQGGTSSLYRIRKTANGAMFACGSQGTILKWIPPLEADFTATPTTVCTGDNVNFEDLSTGAIDAWAWVFEGGTPATSTLENPVVTYNTPGTYDVQLTVTAGAFDATEIKSDYITVYGALVAPATPTGPDEVCGTYSYQYITESVQYADSYDWEVSPASAGTISGDDTVGTLLASNTWDGDYTIKVRAENQCGDGPWSADFTGTLHHDPVVFDLMGDGAFCEGGDGAELTMSDSENGVSYELFKDNVTTGVVIAGTGEPVSFGFYDETGLYTATGFTDNCSETMVGQVYVHMEPAPGQAGMPEGDESVCDGESSDYMTSGAADADDYTWMLDPEEAGVMSPDGDEVSVVWDEAFAGTAYLSVYGMNDCGDGTPSDDLAIMVNALPEPVVAGLSLVCDNDESDYTTADNAGSSYTWEVTGGSIISGAGTYMINVMWGYPGEGSVAVTEMNAEGCEGTSTSFAVTIDDCTGIHENSTSLTQLYPNPATDKVTITGLNEATIKVYNLLGKEVYSLKEARGQLIINTSSFEKGLYLVKVEQDEELSVFQLIKR